MKPIIDTDLLSEHLDRALDALLTARVLASQSLPEPSMPEEGLDAALRQHKGFQGARRAVSEVLAAVDVALGENRNLVFDLEGAVNALVGQACEVAWQLAWTATAAARRA